MTLGHDLFRGLLTWDSEIHWWIFQIWIQHSIIGGWSLWLVLNKLRAIYESGNAPPAPSYTKFTQHYVDDKQNMEVANREFWSRFLGGARPWTFQIYRWIP